jgi:hypothetical protein
MIRPVGNKLFKSIATDYYLGTIVPNTSKILYLFMVTYGVVSSSV